MRRSLASTLAELARTDPPLASRLTLEELIAARERVSAELAGRGLTLEELRYESFRSALADAGRNDATLARRLTDSYLHHRFAQVDLYDDVVPALHALAQRYTLGMISNSNSRIEGTPLEGRLSFTMFSEQCGFEKPHPAIFRAAATRAGCELCEMLHVGDSLRTDVAGAKAAGCHHAWLNRLNLPSADGVRWEIHSLADLTQELL